MKTTSPTFYLEFPSCRCFLFKVHPFLGCRPHVVPLCHLLAGSLLPVFKDCPIIALYSLAACYCLTCTRLGYRPSRQQGLGWQPGDRSEVDVGEGETGSKTLDHTQLIGVTTGVKDMSLNQKTKAWRRQEMWIVGEVGNRW